MSTISKLTTPLLLLSICTIAGCRFFKAPSTPTVKSGTLYKQTKLINVNPVSGRINHNNEAIYDIEFKLTIHIASNGLIDTEISEISTNPDSYSNLNVIAEQKSISTNKTGVDLLLSILHTGSYHPLSPKCKGDKCKPLAEKTAETKRQTKGHSVSFDFPYDRYPELKPSTGITLQMAPPTFREFPVDQQPYLDDSK